RSLTITYENNKSEVNAAGSIVPTVGQNSLSSTNTFSAADMPELEDITYSDDEDVVGVEADFNNLESSILKVWVLVDLPYGKRAISTKWVYRNKKDKRGIIIRNKARLVTQGHTQEEGIGYEEVFALVARIEAIRLFLAYASFMGFIVYQMDVKSAFLYGTIKEEVYVCQPLGFEDPNHPEKVYKVVKALYGLHQAPRAWYETLASYLLENGFHKGTIDQTLFIKKQKGDILLCKKQTVVATSSIEAEYVAAASCFQKKTALGKDTSNPLMADNFQKIVWYSTHHVTLMKKLASPKANGSCEGFNQVIDFLNASYIKYALTINPHIYVSCIKQFKNTVVVKQTNDVTRLQALVDKKKVVITEATIRDALHLDDAEGVDYLPNEEIFAELDGMGYEKPSTKLTFYKAFFSSQWKFLIHTILQSMSAKRTSWNEFNSTMTSAIICLSTGVETPLFEGMLVVGVIEEEGDAEEQVQDVADDVAAQGADTAVIGDVVQDQSIPSPTPPTPPPQQPQDLPSTSQEEEKKAKEAKVAGDDQEDEPTEVQEVVDVVTTANVITEVVIAASESITAASTTIAVVEPQVLAATITAVPVRVATASTRRRKGVVIRDPKEESSTIIPANTKSKDKGKGIMVEEPKPLKKKQQVEMDEEYARKLHEELNKDIDWNVAIDHVKQKAKEDPFVQRYKVMKKRPQTKAQARKNMIMYLKNVAGFRLDFFKGMSYDDIRPIFKAKFNSNIEFLLKTKEQLEEEENRAIQSINETRAQKEAKRRKLKISKSIWRLCLMKMMMCIQRLLHLQERSLLWIMRSYI
nr:putative ribonuclease H-like domain-containing protein [Tanacetum cinerariifolium]